MRHEFRFGVYEAFLFVFLSVLHSKIWKPQINKFSFYTDLILNNHPNSSLHIFMWIFGKLSNQTATNTVYKRSKNCFDGFWQHNYLLRFWPQNYLVGIRKIFSHIICVGYTMLFDVWDWAGI